MTRLEPQTREAVLQIAKWQIGVQESPAGSNKVKYNTDYYGKEVSGSAYPWCMAWVWWVFHEAGFNLRKTASCTNLTNAYKAANQWVTKNFKPGDIAMFDFTGKKKKTQHCGIIIEVHDNYIVTIEGNTSLTNNDNGGAVMQRTRDLQTVTGACRPLYNM